MDTQFIFFCTNIGNEQLLKEEVKCFFPELHFGYSRKGFLTFKNTGVKYTLETISQLELAFATRSGLCLGKSDQANLKTNITEYLKQVSFELSKCAIHNFSINFDGVLNSKELIGMDNDFHTPINKTVLNLMSLSENEIWIGIHKVTKTTTRYPNSDPQIKLPELSPSRSYLKIAQAVELYNLNIDPEDNWIDFGSSPGGASFYLLDKGHKVWGVDPAEMSKEILDHKNFNHVMCSVQDLSQEELPDEKIHWAYVEININPKQAIKEVLRLIKKYNFSLKGIIFNIQMIKMDHVKNIEFYEDHLYDWGLSNLLSRQLPSHGKEYVIIARRD